MEKINPKAFNRFVNFRCGSILKNLLHDHGEVLIRNYAASRTHLAICLQNLRHELWCLVLIDLVSCEMALPSRADVNRFYSSFVLGKQGCIPYTLTHFSTTPLLSVSFVPPNEISTIGSVLVTAAEDGSVTIFYFSENKEWKHCKTLQLCIGGEKMSDFILDTNVMIMIWVSKGSSSTRLRSCKLEISLSDFETLSTQESDANFHSCVTLVNIGTCTSSIRASLQISKPGECWMIVYPYYSSDTPTNAAHQGVLYAINMKTGDLSSKVLDTLSGLQEDQHIIKDIYLCPTTKCSSRLTSLILGVVVSSDSHLGQHTELWIGLVTLKSQHSITISQLRRTSLSQSPLPLPSFLANKIQIKLKSIMNNSKLGLFVSTHSEGHSAYFTSTESILRKLSFSGKSSGGSMKVLDINIKWDPIDLGHISYSPFSTASFHVPEDCISTLDAWNACNDVEYRPSEDFLTALPSDGIFCRSTGQLWSLSITQTHMDDCDDVFHSHNGKLDKNRRGGSGASSTVDAWYSDMAPPAKTIAPSIKHKIRDISVNSPLTESEMMGCVQCLNSRHVPVLHSLQHISQLIDPATALSLRERCILGGCMMSIASDEESMSNSSRMFQASIMSIVNQMLYFKETPDFKGSTSDYRDANSLDSSYINPEDGFTTPRDNVRAYEGEENEKEVRSVSDTSSATSCSCASLEPFNGVHISHKLEDFFYVDGGTSTRDIAAKSKDPYVGRGGLKRLRRQGFQYFDLQDLSASCLRDLCWSSSFGDTHEGNERGSGKIGGGGYFEMCVVYMSCFYPEYLWRFILTLINIRTQYRLETTKDFIVYCSNDSRSVDSKVSFVESILRRSLSQVDKVLDLLSNSPSTSTTVISVNSAHITVLQETSLLQLALLRDLVGITEYLCKWKRFQDACNFCCGLFSHYNCQEVRMSLGVSATTVVVTKDSSSSSVPESSSICDKNEVVAHDGVQEELTGRTNVVRDCEDLEDSFQRASNEDDDDEEEEGGEEDDGWGDTWLESRSVHSGYADSHFGGDEDDGIGDDVESSWREVDGEIDKFSQENMYASFMIVHDFDADTDRLFSDVPTPWRLTASKYRQIFMKCLNGLLIYNRLDLACRLIEHRPSPYMGGVGFGGGVTDVEVIGIFDDAKEEQILRLQKVNSALTMSDNDDKATEITLLGSIELRQCVNSLTYLNYDESSS